MTMGPQDSRVRIHSTPKGKWSKHCSLLHHPCRDHPRRGTGHRQRRRVTHRRCSIVDVTSAGDVTVVIDSRPSDLSADLGARRTVAGRRAWAHTAKEQRHEHHQRIQRSGPLPGRSAAPTGPVRHRIQLAGPHRGADTAPGHRDVDVRGLGTGGASDHLDVGPDPRAAAIDVPRRHPLRHHVVQVRHGVRRRVGRHAARRCRTARYGHPRDGDVAHRLHHQPPARGRDRRQGLGGVGRGGARP